MLWFIAEIILFLFVVGVGFWLFGWWTRGKFLGSMTSEHNQLHNDIKKLTKDHNELKKNHKKLVDAMPKPYDDSAMSQKLATLAKDFNDLAKKSTEHFHSNHSDTIFNDKNIQAQVTSLEASNKSIRADLMNKISSIPMAKEYNDASIKSSLSKITDTMEDLSARFDKHFSEKHTDTIYDDRQIQSTVKEIHSELNHKIDQLPKNKTYDDENIRKEMSQLDKKFSELNTKCTDHFKSTHQDTIYNDTAISTRIAALQNDISKMPKNTPYDDTKIRNSITSQSQKIDDLKRTVDAIPRNKEYDDSAVQQKLSKLQNNLQTIDKKCTDHFSSKHQDTVYNDHEIQAKLKTITSDLNRKIDAMKPSATYDDGEIKKLIQRQDQNLKNLEQKQDAHFKQNHQDTVYNDQEIKNKAKQNEGEIVRFKSQISELQTQLTAHVKMPHQAQQAPKKSEPRKKVKNLVKISSSKKPDDLTTIKGIGQVIQSKLRRMGVKYFEQIARWSRQDIKHFSEKLSFKGRIDREKWVVQAQKIVAARTKKKSQSVFEKAS